MSLPRLLNTFPLGRGDKQMILSLKKCRLHNLGTETQLWNPFEQSESLQGKHDSYFRLTLQLCRSISQQGIADTKSSKSRR